MGLLVSRLRVSPTQKTLASMYAGSTAARRRRVLIATRRDQGTLSESALSSSDRFLAEDSVPGAPPEIAADALDMTLPPQDFTARSTQADPGSSIDHAAASESSLISVVRPRVYELLTPPAAPALIELELVSRLTGEVETVRIDSSLVLVGRSSQCELRLMHADVSRRHACLHVLRDRILCVDLGSRTGLRWDGKRRQTGWLDAKTPVSIGPYDLRLVLRGAVTDSDFEVPEAETFSRQPLAESSRAGSGLRFLNRKDVPTREVPLARPITLIGRDQHCKLRLKDDSVSRVHSSLMMTADGVWVMDLLGRGGVKVNGELVSSARLAPGDELQIGLYRMQFVDDITTDEVSGDMLPAWSGSGELPVAPAPPPATAAAIPLTASTPFAAHGMVSESLLLAMTETFADMQRQMHEQFRLQMDFMAGIVESVRRESNKEIHAELARLAAITEEIREAQKSLSRAALTAPEPTTLPPPAPALEQPAPDLEKAPPDHTQAPSEEPLAPSEDAPVDGQPEQDEKATQKTAIPDENGAAPRRRPVGSSCDVDAVAEHALLTRRLRDLERERNSSWTKIVRMLKRDA